MIRFGIVLSLFLACTPLHAEIMVAVVGPMSGPYASLGALMRAGAQQAVADINASGGVNGEALGLDVLDDACDVAKATAIANQVVGRGVRLVVGHLCSSTSIAASQVYALHDIVQISPASSNPKFTDERPATTVLRIFHRSDQQAPVAAAYILKEFADKRIALVHDSSAYGKGLADDVKRILNEAGVQEVLFNSYSAGEKDYVDLVAKLTSEQIDLVFVGGYHAEAGLIMRAMRDQNLSTALMSGDAIVTDEFWAITADAGEGTLVTFPPDARKAPEAAGVVEAFRNRNVEPESYVLYSYAAVQAWARAAAEVGATDSKTVAAALSAGAHDTVLGKLSFDAKGDVNLPGFAVHQWKAGKIEPVN